MKSCRCKEVGSTIFADVNGVKSCVKALSQCGIKCPFSAMFLVKLLTCNVSDCENTNKPYFETLYLFKRTRKGFNADDNDVEVPVDTVFEMSCDVHKLLGNRTLPLHDDSQVTDVKKSVYEVRWQVSG